MRVKPQEMVLMTLPVLVLAGVGFVASRNARPRVEAPVPIRKPFRLSVAEVAVTAAPPRIVRDGYDTVVTVHFGHEGTPPSWWTAGYHGRSGQSDGRLWMVRSGKTKALKEQPFRWTPWTNAAGKWSAEYRLKLAKVPASAGDIRLRDKVRFGPTMGPPWFAMPIDVLVRPAGMRTKVPVVSRKPGLKVAGYCMARMKTQAGRESWRLEMLFRPTATGVAPERNDVDARMAAFTPDGSNPYFSRGAFQMTPLFKSHGMLTSVNNRKSGPPQAFFWGQDFELDAPEKAALAKGRGLKLTVGYADFWPQEIRLPLVTVRQGEKMPPGF